MAKFTKKPIIVEAITFEELKEYAKVNSPAPHFTFTYAGQHIRTQKDGNYVIPTLEGEHLCTPLDMLIIGIKGEIYPCKKDIFAASYDVTKNIVLDIKRNMIHLEAAEKTLNKQGNMLEDGTQSRNITEYIHIVGNKITFTIQDGVIPEKGINGMQVTDVLKYINELYKSLNAKYKCKENVLTILHLQEAINQQVFRTIDRLKRMVEGQAKA